MSKTNKLLEYGLEAAQIGKILLESVPKAQQLYSDKAHYWPSEDLPFAYAMACVQVALDLNPPIRPLYVEIIRAWGLPGCQFVIQDFRKDLLDKAESLKGRPPRLQYVFRLIDNKQSKFTDSRDFEYLIDQVAEFIKAGFNREKDQANEAWKVLPSLDVPWLFNAVTTWTLADYLGIKLEDWNKYKPLVRDGKAYDTEDIMTNKPTHRLRRELTQYFKRYGKLIHDKKLLKGADQWYKCRVNPGTITDYLDQLADQEPPIFRERARISLDLAPYDEATGYPRQWRK